MAEKRTSYVGVKLTEEELSLLDEEVSRMQKETPLRVTRSDVLRISFLKQTKIRTTT